MKGMYSNCFYEKFSITDVGKFERRLKMWCREECMHGKSMIIFDRPSLLVGGNPSVETIDGKTINKVVLPNITLTFICIASKMCIMYKIWENKTNSVIYNMPEKWDGSELWICD